MPDYTDEEYDALDEYYTKNPPKVDPAKNGGFAKKSFRMITVDDLSADWLRIKAEAEHTTPEAIIGRLVREKIAQATPV
ncbi:MAG: hypothetical protein LBQ55_10980 [Treponema sp.]|jgi:hypothetical protein|nr:hypothetical protein [Treponema sp.]